MIRPLCLLACASLALAEQPFAFDRTPGKLPKDVVPVRYAVSLAPSVETKTFTGSVTIDLQTRRPTRRLVLNSLGLAITKATLDGAALAPRLDEAQQTLAFDLPRELDGKAQLAISFSGKLSEATEGLYLTRYSTPGGDKLALTTQCQATDARRIFPCWDEPVFRAKFQLSLRVPAKWTAISNMPAISEAVDGAVKTVTFAETPSMVSYLFALSAGELESLEDSVEGIKLRVFTTEGKREQARYALNATKEILAYFNDYFGVKYPLPQLDQVSFASTSASGMENWGCIIYNDTAFLYDPAVSTQATKERVYAVVAHELAHMWFGDLVTMAWWDNLWLNEGFASWMGTKATDRFNPEWKMWLRAADDKERAMQLDARATTHPIQEKIENEAQAFDVFDEITYDKGQSFIRMLEGWLGEEKFRDGIRRYMQRHAYGNTTTADLWIALAEASGQPVAEMAAGWTMQPGFPLVKVTRLDDERVGIAQERFSYAKLPPLTWQIPVILGTAPYTKPLTKLLGADKLDFSLAGKGLKANLGDTGYYRVSYDPLTFAELAANVSTLPEADRLNLLNDTWALAEANRAPATQWLELAQNLRADPSPTIIEQIVDTLGRLDFLARGRTEQSALRAWARAFFQPHLARLGWDARPGESPLDAVLRTKVIGQLGTFGDEAVQREAQARFARFEADPATLTGDLRAQVLRIIGRTADDATYAKLRALVKAETSTEQKRLLLGALAASQNPEHARQTLALSLTGELVPRAATRLVIDTGAEHPALALDFAKANLEALLGQLPAFAANDYVPDIFRNFTDASRARELEAFAQSHLPPTTAPSVARAADQIRHRAEVKARVLPEIETWCRAHLAP
jgi:aminopeptidase N